MIKVRNLHFSYHGEQAEVLRGVDLDLEAGTLVTLMGTNASGKSTLARCLNGLLLPTEGEVTVDDLHTCDTHSLPEIRRRVGLMFQDPNHQLTSPTVERELAFGLQNLAMPQHEIRVKVDNALLRLGLEVKRMLPPSSLSGGEKQRLVLAAIRLCNPRYLILDEPTSFLSPTWRKTVFNDLMQLVERQGVAILLITQYQSEAERSDRVILLDEGKVLASGTPSEVLKHRSRKGRK